MKWNHITKNSADYATIATSGENFSKVQAYLLLAYLVRNRGMVYIRLGTPQATGFLSFPLRMSRENPILCKMSPSDASSVTNQQPIQTEQPGPKSFLGIGQHTTAIRKKLTTKRGWLGDYDYAWLCSPTLPFSFSGKRPARRAPPFYSVDAELPLILAMASGLQHALAMLAGLITPPIIFASTLMLDAQTSAYMISASLIGCGT